ncbi:uncharacterized protein EV420DRAFT_1480591 [Desarmillaria tabescens]|uniref:DUF6534 domain-containing protein n=1 Tax=Armillaria tabescens TaxID=1929756 RepID=A0AA39KAD4_ARMTA|nr:uncharacterized protein EV420DRAFT_1480591 [Desarmillaria tabescens]KAK0457522.1 hypothetical protein EV420DRAFT_1480591 [Desarmillaria tabescens]
MTSQSSTSILSLGEMLGPLLIGAIIAAILFGITNLQAVNYYQRYPHDWVLDTFHVALSIHALYFYLVTMFGDLIGGLESDLWSMKLQLSLNNFLVFYVQWLYAIRLWKRLYFCIVALDIAITYSATVGRHFHKVLPWFVFLAVAMSLGDKIVLIVLCICLILVSFRQYHMFGVWNYTKSLIHFPRQTDWTITPMMCYYLHKSRKDAMFSTCVIFLYIVWPESLIFVGIHFVLSKLYINSLLAMLNSRSVHHSTSRSTERGVNSFPAVLPITHHSSESNETHIFQNVGVPLQHIGSFNDKLNPSKGALDSQV